MHNSPQPPNLNSLKDHAVFGVLATASAALLAGVLWTVASPWLTAAGVAFSSLINVYLNPYRLLRGKRHLFVVKSVQDKLDVSKIQDFITRLAAVFGMSKTPSLAVLLDPTTDFKKNLPLDFSLHYHPGGSESPLVSAPLVARLNASSIGRFIVHDLVNKAASINTKAYTLVGLYGAATMTAFLNLGAKLCSPLGVLNLMASLTTGAVTKRMIAPALGLNQNAAQNAGTAVFDATLLGTAALTGQTDVIAAWALAKASALGARAISGGYARSSAYQTDRIVAQIEGSPQGMIEALEDAQRAITTGRLSIAPRPSLARRINRLHKMAVQP